jgi:hypothetical protein
VSRIWEEIKRAERQRSRVTVADSGENLVPRARDRRKVLRYAYFIPVLVYGSDVDKQPFHEEAETVDANKNGCLLTLEGIVAPGQRLFLINMRNQAEQECRVAHVGERAQGRARVGIEFLHPASYFWRGQ